MIQLKPRIIPRWNKFFDEVVDTTSKRAKKRERRRLKAMASGTAEFDVRLNEQQHVLLSFISQYQDMLYCARTHENALSTMSVYAAHALNHVLKTRDLILKHNNLLSQHALAKKEKGKPKPDAPEFKDQGYTRPKVLVVLPMRNSCLEFVDVLLSLAPKTQADRVANKNKFYEEFFDEVFEPKTQKPRMSPSWSADLLILCYLSFFAFFHGLQSIIWQRLEEIRTMHSASASPSRKNTSSYIQNFTLLIL
jgi:hypothetical protein